MRWLVVLTLAAGVAVADPAQNQQLFDGGKHDLAITGAIGECTAGAPASCEQAAGFLRTLHVDRRLGTTPDELHARALALWTAQCDAGTAESCAALGKIVGATDPDRGRALIEQACTLRDGAACLHLAGMYATGTHVRRDDRRAAALIEQACAAGDAGACTQAGDRVARRDPARATALYRTACDGDDARGCVRSGTADDVIKACDLGLPESCVDAAARLERGRGIAQDEARARELYGRACDRDVGAGCAGLAAMIGDGRGGARRWRDAVELAAKACRLRAPGACAIATRMDRHPPAVTCATADECAARCEEQLGAACRKLAELRAAADPSCEDAAQAYGDGCRAGDAASCLALGNLGQAPEASYERACAGGLAEACTLLHYVRAIGDAADPQELELLRRSCARAPGSAACVWYGRTLVTHDDAQAERLFRAACARGDARGCRLLGQTLGAGLPSMGVCDCDEGAPTPPTPPEAQRRLEQACTMGDAIACDVLDKPVAATCDPRRLAWDAEVPWVTPIAR